MTFTSLSDYQDIFRNSIAVFPTFFITLQSIEEDEYGKTSHSKIFTFCRHFMIILKRNFLGLQYYIISQTLIRLCAMHLRFVKLETLLNNAFKYQWTDCFKSSPRG